MALDYEHLLAELLQRGVRGVEAYRKKLDRNAAIPENLEDLLREGDAAIMFRKAGFQVLLRDSPDLELATDGQAIFAEVKHFRWKVSDDRDGAELRLAVERGRLVPYGDTFDCDGKHPWEEVFDVAKKKATRLCDGTPNILVVASSSSHAIDDAIIPTAVNLIDEAAVKNSNLLRINGVMLLSRDFHLGERRSTWFFPTQHQAVPLAPALIERIQGIKEWRRHT